MEAIGKIRVLEPQLTKNEAEFEKLSRETKKIEKKNRALMETQRHYELDRKELTSELQVSFIIHLSDFYRKTSFCSQYQSFLGGNFVSRQSRQS